MPNLLYTAADWTEANVSPPASWSGTAYLYTFAISQRLTLSATAASGDSIDFATTNNNPPPSVPDTPTFRLNVNGVDVASGDMGSADVHWPLAAGDAVYLQMDYPPNGCGYSGDWTVTPIDPPAPVKRLQFEVRMGTQREGA